jgi:hypothetical protein
MLSVVLFELFVEIAHGCYLQPCPWPRLIFKAKPPFVSRANTAEESTDGGVHRPPGGGSKTREVRPRLRRNSFPHKQANKEVRANLDTILELKVARLAILPPF